MNNKTDQTEVSAGETVLYQPDETIKIEVRLDVEHDTVWLNTMQMSQLFNIFYTLLVSISQCLIII